MTTTLVVYNTSQGPTGAQGPQGIQGPAGQDADVMGAFIKDTDTTDDLTEGSNLFTNSTEKEEFKADWMVFDITGESENVSVGVLKTFRLPAGFLLKTTDGLRASVNTAPTGSAVIIDIKQNGSSIFGGTKLTIDAGSKTSKGSATPYVLRNNAFWDDAECTVEVTQVGSTTPGAGLKLYFKGKEEFINPLDLVPDYLKTFSTAVEKMTKTLHFKFGTSRTAEGGPVIPITGLSTLDDYFDYKGLVNGPSGDLKINKEIQCYLDLTNTYGNFQFGTDYLDLVAKIPDPTLLGLITKSPTANVNYSREVPVADASDVPVGSVLGFKKTTDGLKVDSDGYINDEGFLNFQATRIAVVGGTITVGDTISVAFTNNTGAWSGAHTITITAQSGDTTSTLAQKMVDAITADATLSGFNVKAYIIPGLTNAYAITWPKATKQTDTLFGNGSSYALLTVTYSFTKTGTVTHTNQSSVQACFVIAKSGNTLILNHPVTLTTSSVITVSPTRLLIVKSAGTSSVAFGVDDTTGLKVRQLVALGFQDSTLRAITALTSTTIKTESTSGIPVGLVVGVYPAHSRQLSAAISGNTITMSAGVPEGVQVGMHCFNYFGTAETINPTLVSSIDRVANTVTLDWGDKPAPSWASGSTIYFFPPVFSAQIVSKFLMRPGTDAKGLSMNPIAHRVRGCYFPCVADIAGWPADWLYSSNRDTDDHTGSGGSEIDILDAFNYWNNAATNRARAGAGSGTDLYIHPDSASAANLNGNNLGIKERDLALIWLEDKIYIYFDDVLVWVRAFAYNKTQRAEFIYNLAVGSVSTSFNGNGFWPVDYSRFPMIQRIKEMEFWSFPNQMPPQVL